MHERDATDDEMNYIGSRFTVVGHLCGYWIHDYRK